MRRPQIIAFSLFMSGVVLLSACSQSTNPLNQPNKKATAQFLLHASQYAEKQLGIFQAPGGDDYGACMTGRLHNQPLCQQLYEHMIIFAKQTKTYQGLTVPELTNPTVFNGLKDAYNQATFGAV